jgi:hypothetical protein
VIGIAKPHDAYAILTGQIDRTTHAGGGVEWAGAAVPVPLLPSIAGGADALGARLHVNDSGSDIGNEPQHAIDTVRGDAVTAGLSEDPRARRGAISVESDPSEDPEQHTLYILERNTNHRPRAFFHDNV